MHIVIHTDTDGDTTDVSTYCTDSCARTNPDYAGWYGAQEPGPDDVCAACGAPIGEAARAPRAPRRTYAPHDAMAALINHNVRAAYTAARADQAVYHAGIAWYREARIAIHRALCDEIARSLNHDEPILNVWQQYATEDHEDTARVRALFVHYERYNTIPSDRQRRIMADILGRCSKATPWYRQRLALPRAAELAMIISTAHTYALPIGPTLPERFRRLSLYPVTVEALWRDMHARRNYELLPAGSGKLYQFSRALDGDDSAIPVDRHMARAAGARDVRATRHVISVYTEVIQQTVRDLAAEYQSTPATVQAVVWEWTRAHPIPTLAPMALVGMIRR